MHQKVQLNLNIKPAWANYFWTTSHFTKTWQLVGHFNKVMCERTDSQYSKLNKGRYESASLKLLDNSTLLQISKSGMPVVEVSLTLSFLHQYQCYSGSKSETIVHISVCYSIYGFKFDLHHRRKCALTHICMCFQTSNAFLVRNLSVWEIYLCRLISWSSPQSLTPLALYIFIKRCYACSTVIKITNCRDGQLVWLGEHFEKAAFRWCIDR